MKNYRRILLPMLAAAMAILLSACGKKEDNSAGLQKEYVWVPQFLDLSDEQLGYSNLQIRDGILYYLKTEWDSAAETSTCAIRGISLSDGTEKSSVLLRGGPEAPEQGEDDDGSPASEGDQSDDVGEEDDAAWSSGRNIQNFTLDSAGNIITYESLYHWDEASGESSQEHFLCKYDASGKKVSEADFTEEAEDYLYLQTIFTDAEGRIYAAADSDIFLFDAECAFRGKITPGNEAYIRSAGVDGDGAACVVVTDYTGGQSSSTLREIDFDGKAFGQSYANYPRENSGGQLTPGLEKSTLLNDGSRVYEYDKKSQTAEELFSWLDSDINGDNISYMGVLGDGRILAVTRDWESGKSEIALLTKTKASEAAQKTTILVGCFYENSRLKTAAVDFNKNNDSYRISIRSYFDYNSVQMDDYQTAFNDAINRLNSDIISKNCPDMLDLRQLNVSQLASKGVFEDLNPYLEKSSALSREDYITSILDSYTYDGTLVAIPRSFELSTVVGRASGVGAEPGWTLEEMLAYADKHPEAAILDGLSKTGLLGFLLSYNQGAFVDWKSGKCSFDSDSFRNLLEFTNRFPDEVDWQNDDRSTPTKIAQGEVLLDTVYLYSFNSIQEVMARFDEPVTFIGYPNDEGSSGCYIQADGLLSITSKSKNKDGAWAFLEQYLMAESTWDDFGFSTRKEVLQAAREEATKEKYFLDENGEPVLDENDEPISMGGTSSISYGDGWTYEYHTPTEEEADILMHLMDIARPATGSDSQIMNIINEEAEAFFKGDKTAAEVAGIIQSRVKVYVDENR